MQRRVVQAAAVVVALGGACGPLPAQGRAAVCVRTDAVERLDELAPRVPQGSVVSVSGRVAPRDDGLAALTETCDAVEGAAGARAVELVDEAGALWRFVVLAVGAAGGDVGPRVPLDGDAVRVDFYFDASAWFRDSGMALFVDEALSFAVESGPFDSSVLARDGSIDFDVEQGPTYGPTSTNECGTTQATRVDVRTSTGFASLEIGDSARVVIGGAPFAARALAGAKLLDEQCTDGAGHLAWVVERAAD